LLVTSDLCEEWLDRCRVTYMARREVLLSHNKNDTHRTHRFGEPQVVSPGRGLQRSLHPAQSANTGGGSEVRALVEFTLAVVRKLERDSVAIVHTERREKV
jgi:hypothetical protein